MLNGNPRNYLRDEKGAVAATYGISLFALVAIAGVAFDYSRMAGLDSELQNAADQAALAAATQLDRKDGACARSANAAISLLSNETLLANDTSGRPVTVSSGTAVTVSNDDCEDIPGVTFYEGDQTTVAKTDETARFVEVDIDARTANYALTPVVGLFSASMDAKALAGLGSAICEVPPLMICRPDDDAPFNAAARRGWGVQATGKGSAAWAPGDFGFLEVGAGQLQDLAQALAYVDTPFDCVNVDEGSEPETGNAQVLFDAINTRFDIQPNSANGASLKECQNGLCPPALNVVKDVVKMDASTKDKDCRLGNKAWELPTNRFDPDSAVNLLAAGKTAKTSKVDSDGLIDAMGLGRDMCHYTNYGVSCKDVNGNVSTKFGDGNWAIFEYFAKYHPTVTLSSATPVTSTTPNVAWTRYETYLWEISQNNMPYETTGDQRQLGRPLCVSGSTGAADRRVLTVAVVSNCDDLRGGSRSAEIEEWVDMFFVEPVVDDSDEVRNGRTSDTIYMEVIGPATLGQSAGNTTTQAIRRDKPFLVE